MAASSVLIFLLFFSTGGLSQCYTDTNCTGETVPANSQRECCVETDEGLSFFDTNGLLCAVCIGKYLSYNKNESSYIVLAGIVCISDQNREAVAQVALLTTSDRRRACRAASDRVTWPRTRNARPIYLMPFNHGRCVVYREEKNGHVFSSEAH